MLYLVATPIGNLGDFSYRGVELLRQCDYILCEDTRQTVTLLKHYHIDKPLKSFHKFNEAKLEDLVISDLKKNMQIALVSDRGTPGISDPGHRLVVRCQKESLPYSSIPGACSPIVALTLSGLPTERFQFVGFLPKKMGELKECLLDYLCYSGTTIAFESPQRLIKTLALLNELSPETEVAIARELTKIHESCLKAAPKELLLHFDKHPPKGEIVLLFHRETHFELDSSLSAEEQVERLQQQFQITKMEAIKLAATLSGRPKKEFYH